MTQSVRTSLVILLTLLISACGRKGALIYPDTLLPAAPALVSAQQSGAVIKLQFSLPVKDAGGRTIQEVAGVKISRRTTGSEQKGICRSCMTDYQPLHVFYLGHLPAAAQRFGGRLIVADSDVTAGNSYSYSIVPFTADGIDGAMVKTGDVPVVPTLLPPALSVDCQPTEISVRMSAPSGNAGRFIGYNLYRAIGTTVRSYQPLNSEPLVHREYTDTQLERGVTYRYSARALFVAASGTVVESAESEEVAGKLKDDE
ncbi:MAG: fibronectin type III domain-containing protein [Desulfuromonadaceae bacterium]|nr:fibronectin type III domain-containing protein [Desulfuromonadaceae bacterium]MDD5105039.1 fibronectin type III domain-containing protein [Desulfuromonadaceae bacterium]